MVSKQTLYQKEDEQSVKSCSSVASVVPDFRATDDSSVNKVVIKEGYSLVQPLKEDTSAQDSTKGLKLNYDELDESKSSHPKQRSTRSYTHQQQPNTIGSNTAEEIRKHSLQFPDYSDQAIRLQSFKHWGGVLPAQELAEGGFYMIARRDVVRCFSCNVVVQEWERSDSIVDKHRKYNPECSFAQTFTSSYGTGVKSSDKTTLVLPGGGQMNNQSHPAGGMSESSSGYSESNKKHDSDYQSDIESCVTNNSNIGFEEFKLVESEEENWIQTLEPMCKAVTPVTVCEGCSKVEFDSCQLCLNCGQPVSITNYLPLR